jgi:hypothetical protein
VAHDIEASSSAPGIIYEKNGCMPTHATHEAHGPAVQPNNPGVCAQQLYRATEGTESTCECGVCVRGGWWVGDRKKTTRGWTGGCWHAVPTSGDETKNFGSWKKGAMTLSHSAEYKKVLRRSFFPWFFHNQTRSDLPSSTWKRLTFKTHTHLHVRRGVK